MSPSAPAARQPRAAVEEPLLAHLFPLLPLRPHPLRSPPVREPSLTGVSAVVRVGLAERFACLVSLANALTHVSIG